MGRRAAKNAGRKGKSDAKRAKLNSKIGKLVIQAVKAGGTDPSANRQLGLLFQQAKDYGVPREIVDRNIKKASDANQADISEVTYEVYGHGGTGFIVECLTDNNNRTNSDLSAVVRKAGAKMAEPGSVMFNFQRQGHVVVQGEEVTEDGVFEAAMECGADDVIPCQGEEGGFKVVTAVDRFGAARDALKEMGLPLKLESSGLVYTPLAEVEVDDEQLEANEALVDRIMDLDDVDEVYTNCAGLTI